MASLVGATPLGLKELGGILGKLISRELEVPSSATSLVVGFGAALPGVLPLFGFAPVDVPELLPLLFPVFPVFPVPVPPEVVGDAIESLTTGFLPPFPGLPAALPPFPLFLPLLVGVFARLPASLLFTGSAFVPHKVVKLRVEPPVVFR